MASFGYRSPQFSEDVAWLPPWLQPHGAPASASGARGEGSLPTMGCEDQAFVQFSHENENCRRFQLHLSGDEETPAGSIPSSDTALKFHLHLSSGDSGPFHSNTGKNVGHGARLLDVVAETPVIQSETDGQHKMDIEKCEHVNPLENKLNKSQEQCENSFREDDQINQQELQENLDADLRRTDLNDAVELCIAASEALIISEVASNFESENVTIASILEIALRVKQARQCNLEMAGISTTDNDFDENDELTDLEENAVADAFDDVGLCFASCINSDGENESSKVNCNIYIEREQDKENQHQDTDDEKTVDAFADESKTLSSGPICVEQSKPSTNLPSDSDHQNSLNLSASQAEKVKNLQTMTGLETYLVEDHVKAYKINVKGKPSIGKHVKGMFCGETSFISESMNLMDEYQLEQKPQADNEIIASCGTPIEVHSCTSKESIFDQGRVCSQNMIRSSNLSQPDHLCSIVPCSIDSEDVPNIVECSNMEAEIGAEEFITSSVAFGGILCDEIPEVPELQKGLSSLKDLDQGEATDSLRYNIASTDRPRRKHLNSLKPYSMVMPALSTSKHMIFSNDLVPALGIAKKSTDSYWTSRSTGIFIPNGDDDYEASSDLLHQYREIHATTSFRSNSKHTLRSLSQQNSSHIPNFEMENNEFRILNHEHDNKSIPPLDTMKQCYQPHSKSRNGSSKRTFAMMTCKDKANFPSERALHGAIKTTKYNTPMQSTLYQNLADKYACRNKRVRFEEPKHVSDQIGSGEKLQSESSAHKKDDDTSCKPITLKKIHNDGKRSTTERKGMLFYGFEFLLTGFSSQKKKELEELIRHHGGCLLGRVPSYAPSLKGSWRVESTSKKPPIVLSPKKVHTTKFLFGCAINTWTLKGSWVTDALRAGSLVPPWRYMTRPIRLQPRNLKVEEPLSSMNDFSIFDKAGLMFYGNVCFCNKFSKIVKHGGGQVFKSLQRLVQSLNDKENMIGAIVVENETILLRHLKHCALEYNIQIMPASWIVHSLFSGELLPLKKDRCAPLFKIKKPTFCQDQGFNTSQEI